MDQQIRLISYAFGMAGFTVALVAGVIANNPATTILIHGIAAMIACRFVGMFAGEVLSHVVGEHMDHYRSGHPIPVLLTSAPASDEPIMEVGEEEPDVSPPSSEKS